LVIFSVKNVIPFTVTEIELIATESADDRVRIQRGQFKKRVGRVFCGPQREEYTHPSFVNQRGSFDSCQVKGNISNKLTKRFFL